MNGDEIVLSPETESLLKQLAPKCRLCHEILISWRANGRLVNSPGMPVNAQTEHIRREKKTVEERREKDSWPSSP